MSELATMLGNVYRDRDDEPTPGPRTGGLPDWADEGVLDAAFADWVPGPPSSAPAAERSMLTDLAAGPDAGPATTVLPDPVPTPSEAAVPTVAEEPATELLPMVSSGVRSWHFERDDILPARGRLPRSNFRLR